jgi:hypothetical protein
MAVPKIKTFTPAGYLPAPIPARFISEAEQAAEKLPPSIKPQSLRNALLKGGAKPVELEYAGADKFATDYQGKPIPREDVLDFLKQQGPLGQLEKYEAAHFDDPEQNRDQWGWPVSEWPNGAGQSWDNTKPFSIETASRNPTYPQITVPGQAGDHTGYREVLIFDPLINKERPRAELGLTPSIDPHQSHYWARYNEYPDRIALQNVQSDVGQRVSKQTKRPPLTPEEAESIIFRFEAGVDFPREILDEAGRITGHPDFDPDFDPYSDSLAEPPGYSPIAADDNWKNLMLRHIALQSINAGGKPITIPTGRQMVDVEGFAGSTYELDTPEGRAAAEKSANAYNADLVRRLQKIFRGLHPDGASASHMGDLPEKIVTSINPSDLDSELRGRAAGSAWEISEIFKDRGNRLAEETGLNEKIKQKASEYRDIRLPPIDDPSYPQAAALAERVYDEYQRLKDLNYDPKRNGRLKASHVDEDNLWQELLYYRDDIGEMNSAIEEIVSGGNISPEIMEKIMPYVQYNRLMREMGDAGISKPDMRTNSAQTQPGWTVKPSPAAVRAALEKGLPIMSILAPLLMAPQQGEKK